MKLRLVLISLLGLLLALPVLAGAEGTSCGAETVLAPDGRIDESTIPANTTFWFVIQTTVGRSYSVEIKSKLAPAGTSPGVATFFAGSDGCSLMSTLFIRDTTSTDPPIPGNGTRASFTALDPGDSGRHRIQLVNSSGSAINYTITAAETTLFSPGWSTIGTYATYYSFQNTTSAALNGTISLFTAAGVQIFSLTFPIPANRALFTGTPTLGIPPGLAGTARLTHDGPPGAILAEAAITDFSSFLNFGYVQPVQFKPVRDR